jgi:hypothetical protein
VANKSKGMKPKAKPFKDNPKDSKAKEAAERRRGIKT